MTRAVASTYPRVRAKPVTEHVEQSRLAYMVRTHLTRYPALANLTAVPHAEQSKRQAGRKWAEGVVAGYPDILLDAPRGHWHGLRIELKRGSYWNAVQGAPYAKGEPSEEQRGWHERLTREDYLVFVCWGWPVAWDILRWYVSLPAWNCATIVPNFDRARTYNV